MKKSATKKVVKKVVKKTKTTAKKVVNTPTKIPEVNADICKDYHIVLKFNDQIHDIYTENLEEAILSVKPLFLKTKLMIKIEKGDKVCERQFIGFQAKQFFRSPLFLKLFLKKIYFK